MVKMNALSDGVRWTLHERPLRYLTEEERKMCLSEDPVVVCDEDPELIDGVVISRECFERWFPGVGDEVGRVVVVELVVTRAG